MILRLVFFVTLLFSCAFSTTLTKHSIYEKPDRIDIMLTFDKPYLDKITKTKEQNTIILVLKEVDGKQKDFVKTLKSDIAQKITISSTKNNTQIKIDSINQFRITASKTVDNLGLRIRIQKPISTPLHEDIQPMKIPTNTNTNTKEFDFTFAFVKVLFVLALMIAFLWALKKWIEKKNSSGSWLFQADQKDETIKIITQKPIDMKNKVTLLRFKDKEYLVLLVENNLLLDKFHLDDDEIFDKLLQDDQKKLDEYMKK